MAFIWPFLIFQDLAFLKLFMAKFGFFNFFEPGNPDWQFLLIKMNREEVNVCLPGSTLDEEPDLLVDSTGCDDEVWGLAGLAGDSLIR